MYFSGNEKKQASCDSRILVCLRVHIYNNILSASHIFSTVKPIFASVRIWCFLTSSLCKSRSSITIHFSILSYCDTHASISLALTRLNFFLFRISSVVWSGVTPFTFIPSFSSILIKCSASLRNGFTSLSNQSFQPECNITFAPVFLTSCPNNITFSSSISVPSLISF